MSFFVCSYERSIGHLDPCVKIKESSRHENISNLQDSFPGWENICHNLPQANSWSLKAKKTIQVVRTVNFFFSFSLFFANKLHSGGKYKSAEYMDHEAEHTPLTMVHLPARAAWESLEQAS